MKRLVSGLFFLVVLSTEVLVGQKFTQLWKIDPGSRPQFPASGDVYRGAAYNAATDHYLAVSRAIGLKVYVLNASDGALLDSLNVTGISGGTFALNEVEVTTDGVIYGANLIVQTGADTVYKIYRWADESATPTVAFSGRPGTARIGDSFDVAGTGTGTVIYGSGNAAASVIQTFRTTDGLNFTVGSPITIGGQEAGAGIAQVTPGGNAYVSRFTFGNKVDLVDGTGTVLSSVPDTIFGTAVADIHYFEVGLKKFLAGAPAGATNHDPARLLDVTAGADKAVLVDTTGDLGNNVNGNASGDVDVKINPDGSIVLFVLVGNNGLGAWASVAVPITPQLVTPANNSTDRPLNVVLRWGVSTGAATYRVQVATDLGFTSPVIDDSTVTDTLKQMSGLSINTKYYWRVNAKNVAGTSGYSEIWNFTTGTQTGVADVEAVPNEFSLSQNFPNPFNPTTTIRYHVGAAGMVTLKILDLLGREVSTLVHSFRDPGTYAVTWDGKNNAGSKMSSGVYFSTLTAASFTQTKKMILMQ